MTTQEIAERLATLCREGKGKQAQDELYADDAKSIEMEGAPSGIGNAEGMAEIREKGRKFNDSIEAVHGGTVGDPIVTGDWFALTMTLDATFKNGGRVQMEEICVYQVKNGKIVREQFFYNVGA
jgi:ketosteroid isomerase-like protein